MPAVGTTAVVIGKDAYLIQNLGPDTLYVGETDAVDEENGIQLLVGEALSVGATNVSIYAVSEAASDVRILSRGLGFFHVPAPTP